MVNQHFRYLYTDYRTGNRADSALIREINRAIKLTDEIRKIITLSPEFSRYVIRDRFFGFQRSQAAIQRQKRMILDRFVHQVQLIDPDSITSNVQGEISPDSIADYLPSVDYWIAQIDKRNQILIRLLHKDHNLTCDQCHHLLGPDLPLKIIGDRPLCDPCFNQIWIACETCKRQGDSRTNQFDYSHIDHKHYCSDCADLVPLSCFTCSAHVFHEKQILIEYNDNPIALCDPCLQSILFCRDCDSIIGNADRSYADFNPDSPICTDCKVKRNQAEIRKIRAESLLEKSKSGKAKFAKISAAITNQGSRIICQIIDREITNQRQSDPTLPWITYDQIESTFESRAIVTNRGKITKRIKRNLQRNFKIALSDSVISEIGNIANNQSDPQGEFFVEIDRDFKNTVGKFGDSGSCFRPGATYHSHLLAMEENARFHAIKIYSIEGSRIGRSWAISPSENSLIIFNSYGLQIEKQGSIIAHCGDFGGNFKEIDLESDMWINQDRGIAFNFPTDHFDFEILDQSEKCENCDTRIDPDYCYHDPNNGDHYCEDCYSEIFSYCEKCDTSVNTRNENFKLIQDLDQYVCTDCADYHFHQCEICQKHYKDSREIEGDHYCEDCAIDQFALCENCGDFCPAASDCEIKGDQFCSDCHNEKIRDQIKQQQQRQRDRLIALDLWTKGELIQGESDEGDPFAIRFDCPLCNQSPFDYCSDHYSLIRFVEWQNQQQDQNLPLIDLIANQAELNQQQEGEISPDSLLLEIEGP